LLLGSGSEKHDDAVDALAYLILGVIGDGVEEQKVQYASIENFLIVFMSVRMHTGNCHIQVAFPRRHSTQNLTLLAWCSSGTPSPASNLEAR
jgi:hypothetical protein